MGGDQAPRTEIDGVALALAELPPTFRIQLVGQTAAIEAELGRHPELDRGRLEIVEAPEVIGMAEKPRRAVRRKRKSSIVVGLELQAKGQSDAFISAGNTGALLAASTVLLGLFAGVERATVGTLLPTAEGPVLLLDAGANVYMRDIVSRPSPQVGLLNVGEEEEKGTALVKEAYGLLKQDKRLNYVGNIEGRDILGGLPKLGRVDVVVCDGFVGNVVLKFYESVMYLVRHLAQEAAPDMWQRQEIRSP